MLCALLICSDEDCAATIEITCGLDEVDLLICDECGCALQAIAYWETEAVEAHLPEPQLARAA